MGTSASELHVMPGQIARMLQPLERVTADHEAALQGIDDTEDWRVASGGQRINEDDQVP
jgi:hypothetical protein